MTGRLLGTAVWTALLAIAPTPGARAESVMDYASTVKTIQCSAEVVQRNEAAIKKLGSAFSQSYRFSRTDIWYEEPLRLRMESMAGKIKANYIINGDRKRAFGYGLSKTWNIKGEPGKLQTANIVGLATPSWLHLCRERYVGVETLNGRTLKVFELKYRDAPDGSYFRVSMDPTTKTIVVMRTFNGEDKQKVRYHFLKPVKTSGVHVPTRVEVYNTEGELAGVTEVRGLRVNEPIPEERFKI